MSLLSLNDVVPENNSYEEYCIQDEEDLRLIIDDNINNYFDSVEMFNQNIESQMIDIESVTEYLDNSSEDIDWKKIKTNIFKIVNKVFKYLIEIIQKFLNLLKQAHMQTFGKMRNKRMKDLVDEVIEYEDKIIDFLESKKNNISFEDANVFNIGNVIRVYDIKSQYNPLEDIDESTKAFTSLITRNKVAVDKLDEVFVNIPTLFMKFEEDLKNEKYPMTIVQKKELDVKYGNKYQEIFNSQYIDCLFYYSDKLKKRFTTRFLSRKLLPEPSQIIDFEVFNNVKPGETASMESRNVSEIIRNPIDFVKRFKELKIRIDNNQLEGYYKMVNNKIYMRTAEMLKNCKNTQKELNSLLKNSEFSDVESVKHEYLKEFISFYNTNIITIKNILNLFQSSNDYVLKIQKDMLKVGEKIIQKILVVIKHDNIK